MAKAVIAVAIVAVAFCQLAAAQSYGPCTATDGRPGTCMEPASCTTRAGTVSGRCPGTTPKCCLKDAAVAPVTPTGPTGPAATGPTCTDLIGNSGLCRGVNDCPAGGVQVSGRCPGAWKCCVPQTPLPTSVAAARGQTVQFTLKSQAFPSNGYPGALVYFPHAFNPSAALNVVVFIHGFWNCIQNVVKPAGAGIQCTNGGGKRSPYRLIEQIENSGKNVLLVVAETARDVASGDPGQLGKANGLRNFLQELLSEKLAPVMGARSVDSIKRTIVFGHSAAYQSTSAFARQSGVSSLREIHLLDSLYGYTQSYNDWMTRNKAGFVTGDFKFSNIYYSSTATNSVAQAKSIRTLFASNPSTFVWEDKGIVSPDSVWRTPVIFKASNVKSHDGIPAAFVEKLLAASPI